MDLDDARDMAYGLLGEFGLTDWEFAFDNAVSRFGQCCHHDKTITLSAHLVELNDEDEVEDTLLHEIAHALVGRRHGHDETWRRKAVEVGAKPDRTYSDEVASPDAPYVGECPVCGYTVTRHRLKRQMLNAACPECCDTLNNGQYSNRFQLTWKKVS